MTLPDLGLQIAYGKLAWALVLVALLAACVPRFARRHMVAAAGAVAVLAALPGEWSPAWWLTLAFQYPSGLLAALALLSLHARRQGRPPRLVLPLAIALPLAMTGAIVYLDTFGVLSLGLYYGGFGAAGALLGCAGIAACAIAIWRGHAPRLPLALMAGLLLYALLRLPTGNLWDALLDPLLWMWAVGSALAAGVRQAAAALGAPAPAPVAAPAPNPALVPEPVPAGVAAIEQLQTVRE
ncbi:hypothetical protein [Massilia sp. METH4]|uniref:hypothetical protein n=1 Tax=Massilia sp. METH4 TaxID=3123041 RepID=UPI0030D580C4